MLQLHLQLQLEICRSDRHGVALPTAYNMLQCHAGSHAWAAAVSLFSSLMPTYPDEILRWRLQSLVHVAGHIAFLLPGHEWEAASMCNRAQVLVLKTLADMQVEALGYAIAGEQVPIDLVVTASHGAADVHLSLTCRYREGTAQPHVTLEDTSAPPEDDTIAESPSSASSPQAAELGQATASSFAAVPEKQPGVIERIPVAAKLAARSTKRLRAWMVVPSRGQVAVSAQLTARSNVVGAAHNAVRWLHTHMPTHVCACCMLLHRRPAACCPPQPAAVQHAQAALQAPAAPAR